jgi:UDP-N-acetylmuramyl pentapeptide phosphotransferase/UDP-N-acetylglucosamine-1-phosphate transferase
MAAGDDPEVFRITQNRRGALIAGLGAVAARVALRAVRAAPGLERTNFRGHRVTLAGGPALAIGVSLASAVGAAAAHAGSVGAGSVGTRVGVAAAVAGLGSGAVGLYDDVVGGRPEHAAKGFKGHLRALSEGRVTSGLVKIAGVGASGLIAAALLPARGAGARRVAGVLLGAGVIASSANLANLFDLRPGRAIKVGLIVGAPLAAAPLRAANGARAASGARAVAASGARAAASGVAARAVAAGAVGAAAGLLAQDLGEEIMLGDAGANALGALLGTAFVARAGTAGRLAAFAGLVALTAASEKVSFTQVIERTPGLRELDGLGRAAQRCRPASPASANTGPNST